MNLTIAARRHFPVIVLLASALLPAGRLWADTIVVKTGGGISRVDGTIESVDAAELVYTPLGTDQRSHEPIDSVLRIKASAEPELTEAEQAFADGKWEDAVAKYQRTVQFSTSSWAKYRAAVRLIDAAGRSHQLDAAVAAFIELAKLDPGGAAKRSPELAGVKAEQLAAAIAAVDRAVKGPDLKDDTASVLRQFLATLYLAKGDATSAIRVLGAAQRAPVAPPRPIVHDNAGKFSTEAIEQAERTIERLNAKHHHELMIETFAGIPDAMRKDFAAMGRERFFDHWSAQRREIEGIDGVVVLICMDPLEVRVAMGVETEETLFKPADRDELLKFLTPAIRDGKFDAGLTRTADFVLKVFDERDPNDLPAALAAPRDTRVVFVCDASGSMLNKMATLKDALQKAIDGLAPDQPFNVIFFQDEKCVALDESRMLPASLLNKRNAYKFLDDVTTSGTTDPLPGLTLAFKLHPQLIYLLTDGDFPDNKAVKLTIATLNTDRKVTVNTIAFVNQQDTDTDFLELLKQIASDTGGTYKHVADDPPKE